MNIRESCPDTKIELARLDERIKAGEKFTDVQFKMRDETLRLQALEYERRLEVLNGEQGRIAKIQERFVSADKYEGFRDQVITTLSELKGRTGGARLVIIYFISAATLVLSLLSLFGKFK